MSFVSKVTRLLAGRGSSRWMALMCALCLPVSSSWRCQMTTMLTGTAVIAYLQVTLVLQVLAEELVASRNFHDHEHPQYAPLRHSARFRAASHRRWRVA